MTWVVGDIHGEYEKLRALLKHLPSKARLVFLGDYIDKGKRSRDVVDFLIRLKRRRQVVFLIGNHELKLLQAWQGHAQAKEFLSHYGFKETLESYLGVKLRRAKFLDLLNEGMFRQILAPHYNFFTSLRPFYQEGGYFVVHAGIPTDRCGRFQLHPLEKLVFVRDQFLKTRKKFRNKIVVFGHTAFTQPYRDPYKIGIDTGAVYRRKGYGRLTAFDLKEGRFLDHTGKVVIPDKDQL